MQTAQQDTNASGQENAQHYAHQHNKQNAPQTAIVTQGKYAAATNAKNQHAHKTLIVQREKHAKTQAPAKQHANHCQAKDNHT
jgi:hypothetical protein